MLSIPLSGYVRYLNSLGTGYAGQKKNLPKVRNLLKVYKEKLKKPVIASSKPVFAFVKPDFIPFNRDLI